MTDGDDDARPRPYGTSARSLSTVFEMIRRDEATTRQELERLGELGRAIVASRVGTLLEIGLVAEDGQGSTSGGRAPRLLRFRSDAASILTATLDQTSVGVALADLSGNLRLEHHETLSPSATPQEVCDRIEALFDWLVQRGGEGRPVWGIGLSVPGPITRNGSNRQPSVPTMPPDWNDYPFVAHLGTRFEAPVAMRSSVETMAIGEMTAHPAASVENLLFIRVGRRVDAGLILEGRLFRGTSGVAGQIGQLPAGVGGQSQTLDAVAANDAVARTATDAARSGRSPVLDDILAREGAVTAVDVGQAAQAGDPAAIQILSQSGRVIGEAAANLTTLINPSRISLSGAMAQTNDIFLAAFREAVYRCSHPLTTRDLAISVSPLGSSSGLIGAAKASIEDLFAPDMLRGWLYLGTPIGSPAFKERLGAMTAELAEYSSGRTAAPAAPPT